MQKSAKYALIAVVAIIVLGGAGFYWFVLRDDAPSRASVSAAGTPAAGQSDRASADGSWKVAPADGVFVGYRVQELFGGDTIKKTAVGRTPGVDGTMTVSGTTISTAEVNADISRLKSDRSQRDSYIETHGLETTKFTSASFKLTKPITLPAAPAKGQEIKVTATGDLTLHGVTKSVDIPLTAKWDGGSIAVAGGVTIPFSDFDISPPSNPIVSVDSTGELELQLTFVPA